MRAYVLTPEFLERPYENAAYPTTMADGAIQIAEGWFYEEKFERQSDRYGSICVSRERRSGLDEIAAKPLIGCMGKLIVKITDAHPHNHVGDFANNIRPRNVRIGQCLELGRGILKIESSSFSNTHFIVLEPLDRRETFWMDVQAVHDIYLQTGQLFFVRDSD